MPREYTNKITYGQVHEKRKNGDTYVYDCQYKYDPIEKKNRRISKHLIGKIPKGQTQIISTRPKKKPKQSVASSSNENNPSKSRHILKAERNRAQLAELLEWAGQTSGIDADVHSSMSEGDAEKTISLARYLAATNGRTTPQMAIWQVNHPVPYQEPMTKRICYDLYETLGLDENARQTFFVARAERLGTHPLIAFDTTTIGTYSKNLNKARKAYKTHTDGLKRYKYLLAYSVTDRQPVAYAPLPGNIADVTALSESVTQLDVLGPVDPLLVMDQGFVSAPNIVAMYLAEFSFLVPMKADSDWLKRIVDGCASTIRSIEGFDERIPGHYIHQEEIRKQFKIPKEKLPPDSSDDMLLMRLHVTVSLDIDLKEQQDTDFYEMLWSIRRDLERGYSLEELKPAARKKARKYMQIERDEEDHVVIKWNTEACELACRYHGYLLFLTNKAIDPADAVLCYRKREQIEEFFKRYKGEADGNRPRVWFDTHLDGKMFVQFVALCYLEFLRFRIQKVKNFLTDRLDQAVREKWPISRYKTDKALFEWLKENSLNAILNWFDAYDSYEVSTEIHEYRWGNAVTLRDDRFLELLKGL